MQNLIFTNDVMDAIGQIEAQGDHNLTVWIADENTARLITPAPPCLITIADGDSNKTLETVTRVWDEMEYMGVTRHSLVINLGGGMVTDLGGFAAATFKRGVRFINVPTTLLERIEQDFPGLFGDVRVTGHDVRKGKPNPEPYLKAMTKAGKKSNECLVIENAPLGVQAAHAAGCFTIGVTTGPIPEKDLYKAGADIVYKNMDELAAALPSLLVALSLIKA